MSVVTQTQRQEEGNEEVRIHLLHPLLDRIGPSAMGPSLPGRPISCSVLCARGQLLGPGGDVATKRATY